MTLFLPSIVLLALASVMPASSSACDSGTACVDGRVSVVRTDGCYEFSVPVMAEDANGTLSFIPCETGSEAVLDTIPSEMPPGPDTE